MAAWVTASFDGVGFDDPVVIYAYCSVTTTTSGVKYYIPSYWASRQSTSSSYRITQIPAPSGADRISRAYITDTEYGCENVEVAKYDGILYKGIPIAKSSSTVSAITGYATTEDFFIVTLSGYGTASETKLIFSTYNSRNARNIFWSSYNLEDYIYSVDVPTRDLYKFTGATFSDGTEVIDKDGNFLEAFYTNQISADTTVTCQWEFNPFGNVEDWFSLGSSTLIPESSDSGDTHQHTCAYNATSESPATETSGIWRNPRVTYRVVGDMTLAVTLGAAFAGVKTGRSASTWAVTQSGYMIASVEIHTALGEAPTVTVSGVANEGHEWTVDSSGTKTALTAKATPAIKTYAVSIPITARHRPQNLLSAISGGGELQELTLVARGDPVVVAENGMPCASDMTHGRIEVTATTAAYNDESAPTAGTNFTKTAEPVAHSGVGYKTFSVAVRKELT